MGEWEEVPQDDSTWEHSHGEMPDYDTVPGAGYQPVPDQPAYDTGYAQPGYGSWDTGQYDDEATPFGGVDEVDGLVYSPEAVSPELQWQQQQVNVPLPPVRQRPQPPMRQPREPWKPGPDPEPVQTRSQSALVKTLLVTLIPLTILAGLGMLVYRTMVAYGF